MRLAANTPNRVLGRRVKVEGFVKLREKKGSGPEGGKQSLKGKSRAINNSVKVAMSQHR